MKAGKIVIILCVLNFFAFVIGSIMIGGSAANGHAEKGKFFVSDHGKNTEVTKEVWHYSLWHSRSLFVTHPMAFIMLVLEGLKRQGKART